MVIFTLGRLFRWKNLRTRGIDPVDARDMLIEAFIADVTDEIGHQAIREEFESVVHQWLSDGQEARS